MILHYAFWVGLHSIYPSETPGGTVLNGTTLATKHAGVYPQQWEHVLILAGPGTSAKSSATIKTRLTL